jgi:hypothetical protein
VPSQPNARSLIATLGASKAEILTSLQASTLDSVFAPLLTHVTGGVLRTNVLLELGANSTEIGILASIPMIANLMQPLGAYFSEQTTSRHDYRLVTQEQPFCAGTALACRLSSTPFTVSVHRAVNHP